MGAQSKPPAAAPGILGIHFGDAVSGAGSGRDDERDRRIGYRSDRRGDPRRDCDRHERREWPDTIRENGRRRAL